MTVVVTDVGADTFAGRIQVAGRNLDHSPDCIARSLVGSTGDSHRMIVAHYSTGRIAVVLESGYIVEMVVQVGKPVLLAGKIWLGG